MNTCENYKFLADRLFHLSNLYRHSCREAIMSASDGLTRNNDPDDAARIFEALSGNSGISPTREFAIFCDEYAKVNKFTSPVIFGDNDNDDFLADHPQIAYLKNAFSDKAYRSFSQKFDKVSALYLPGFREVCEEVFSGRCAYAILPVFSSSDGQLASFRQLISKYELNIICAVDINMSDDSLMRYALLKKGLSDNINRQKNSIFDFSVVAYDDFKMGEFLSSCELLGAKVSSVYSYLAEYSDNVRLLNIILDIAEADFSALNLFIEASHVRYSPIGIYSII